MKEYNPAPAHLWIGAPDTLLAQVMNYLQQQFCAHEGCGICTACTHIRSQQHHAVVWICPEKQYTLEDLHIIQERLAFSLAENEQCYFILQKADFLSKQCANSLLKSIEEPPRGYHFILCAEREEYVLPTIQSRCIIRTFAHQEYVRQHQELYAFFTGRQHTQPVSFLNYLQKSTINEIESIDLIDKLLAFWIQKYISALQNNQPNVEALNRVNLLKQALTKPPMPGSSKLFWKTLYIGFFS